MTLDLFTKTFGGPLDDKTVSEIEQYDWRYEPVDGPTANRIVLDLLKRTERRDFSIAGENIDRWQKGWSENLEEFRRTGDVAALEPKYLRPAEFLRLDGRFIRPADPMFERNWYRVFRGWFARRYLAGFDHIFEFGSGSGHNVTWLAREFPAIQVLGLDWAEASHQILWEARKSRPNIGGTRFDFFSPYAWDWAKDEIFPPNAAVLTVGALEQTGLRWRPFLEFLRASQPAMCFHIEPVLEWYDPCSLVDYTAIKLHEGRGFWRGFVDEVEPIWKYRTGFGSLMLEGYSQFAWKP